MTFRRPLDFPNRSGAWRQARGPLAIFHVLCKNNIIFNTYTTNHPIRRCTATTYWVCIGERLRWNCVGRRVVASVAVGIVIGLLNWGGGVQGMFNRWLRCTSRPEKRGGRKNGNQISNTDEENAVDRRIFGNPTETCDSALRFD